MTRFARLLQGFGEFLKGRKDERWHAYTTGARAGTLLVKDRRTKLRYLIKAWHTRVPVGASRVEAAIRRYTRYRTQNIDRFGFVAFEFRENALRKATARERTHETSFFSFEFHSDAVVVSYPPSDPFFRLFETYLRQEGYRTSPSIPTRLRNKETILVYLDTNVL